MRRGEPPLGVGAHAQLTRGVAGPHDIGIAPNGQFYLRQHPHLKAELAMAALAGGEEPCCVWVLRAYRERTFRAFMLHDEEGGDQIEDAMYRQYVERTLPRQRASTREDTIPPCPERTTRDVS
jgi:hypothetical protein